MWSVWQRKKISFLSGFFVVKPIIWNPTWFQPRKNPRIKLFSKTTGFTRRSHLDWRTIQSFNPNNNYYFNHYSNIKNHYYFNHYSTQLFLLPIISYHGFFVKKRKKKRKRKRRKKLMKPLGSSTISWIYRSVITCTTMVCIYRNARKCENKPKLNKEGNKHKL